MPNEPFPSTLISSKCSSVYLSRIAIAPCERSCDREPEPHPDASPSPPPSSEETPELHERSVAADDADSRSLRL